MADPLFSLAGGGSMFSSEDKTESERIPWRKDQAVAWTDAYFDLLNRPRSMFPDQMFTSLDPLQEEALGLREQYARDLGGMVDPALQAWRSSLSAPDVASNPYVQGMLDQQSSLLNRNLQENILPGIQSGAIGAGQLGSSRQGVAEGIAARGTQEALASQAADTQMRAYLAGLQQQQYGMSATPGMVGLGRMPADLLMGVGEVRRAEDEKALQEEIQRFNFAQDEPWNRLERWAGAYFPATTPFTQTKGSSSYTPSTLQQMGQVAGIASSIGGMFTGGLGGGGGGGNPWQPMTSAPQAAPAAGGGMMPPAYGNYGYGSFLPMSSYGFRGLGSYGGM